MHPDDAKLSTFMFEDATMAFNEDALVLEEVLKGMSDPKSPYLNLGLDAGAMRFRLKVSTKIAAETS